MDSATKLLRFSGAILTATALCFFLWIATVAPSDLTSNFHQDLSLTAGLFVLAAAPFVAARVRLSTFRRKLVGIAFIAVGVATPLLIVVIIVATTHYAMM